MIPRLCPPVALRDLPLALTARGSVTQFETAFAQLANTRHAIAFPYGRTALLCLLEALGLTQRQVLCPSYTCVVVPHAITYSGNHPVFIDCAPNSYLMDMQLAEEATTGETGAMIATSFFGEPVSLDALQNYAKQHPHVQIIQDCAHSFFCEDNGRPVHKAGIAAIYGLNVSKMITSVFGGMVTTDDDALAARLYEVRQRQINPATLTKSMLRRLYFIASRIALSRPVFGGIQAMAEWGLLDRFIRYYDATKIDMPKDYLMALTDFEAAIGTQQCNMYTEVIAHRRHLAQLYHDGLQSCSHLTLPAPLPGHTWSHYTIRTPKAAQYKKRLAGEGVELGEMLEYFIPDMPAYQSALHIDRGIARSYMGHTLNLPVHRYVTEADAAHIIVHMGGGI